MSTPLGIILAGGQATRMGGGDKGLLPLGDGVLLDQVMARLAPQVSGLALNANGDPKRFERFGLPVVADSIAEFPGPLAGVLAGLDWAADQGADLVVSVAADTPFFPDDLVARLLSCSEGQTHPLVLAATPRADGEETKSMSRSGLIRHPTFGLWPVALRDDLRAALKDGLRKVILWTGKHDGREAVFDTAGDPFFNVNTPEDLARAQTLLKEQS
ncbi:molybdenum cofactor guanylyltransferase MobA [Roseovarius faecimaris]|uniref:Molybdenum cofactor guanylyltransferase n=1 Tax=Roseovarius faecimaris TaxID=2494550 RepID=A0A6I6IMB0_9RHOB|nr:molybdenum cofactor guanylyltransferase MobA [Roseovarius faecimaris]QGX96923.1 molybdenum cofactor guanylyltransferase MobA [Roseovarius faecimaris]